MEPNQNPKTNGFRFFLDKLGKPFFKGVVWTLTLTLKFLKTTKKTFTHSRNWAHAVLKKFTSLQLKKVPFAPHLKLPKINHPPRLKKRYFIPIIIACYGIFFFYIQIIKGLPNPTSLTQKRPSLSTKIYSKNGQLLYKIYEDENRTLITLDELPPHVIAATLAIEDQNFYHHPGISLKGIVRALKNNTTHQTLQGGSTITQQLVKNTLLTPERTITRKLKEAILALAVENYFTKDEILEMYFNQVGYGGTAYGIEEGAQQYFGKKASELNLSEAALLAGLPAAPTYLSPHAYPERATQRQQEVLRRMVEEGYLTSQKAQAASKTPPNFTPPKQNIIAPHFVMYVHDELVKRYGEHAVNHGGLEVITTLDQNIQQLTQQTINTELERIKNLHVTNAASMTTNPKTGEILAMVGSKDFFDFKNDGQVNVTLRSRQPGSAIKPITYALALENNFTPATILNDSPVTYHIPGQDPYKPTNYDNTFHGPTPLRYALANSYNVPAVKALNQLGVSNLINFARQLGITTWNNPDRFGLALTLGGGDVKMIDMMQVYGTFANAGTKAPLNPIVSVKSPFRLSPLNPSPCQPTNQTGAKLAHAAQENPCAKSVVSPATAFLISDILSDNRARRAAFGSNSTLNIQNHQVAVKTGTTNNLRDNWTFGYTSDYVVGVWVGNNDNSPMSHVASGITGASPIWQTITQTLLKNQAAAHQFHPPKNVVKKTVCFSRSKPECPDCIDHYQEYFVKGTEPPSTNCQPQKNNGNRTTKNEPTQ